MGRHVRRLYLPLLAAILLAACQHPGGAKLAPGAGSAAAIPPAKHSAGPYRVTVLGDGTEIELLGEISHESVAALQLALGANPRVRVLQLTSPGGSRGAVDAIWPTLLARKLTTVVPLFCASACVELFIAGDRRVLAEGAVLGLHQSYMQYTGAWPSAKVSQATASSDSEIVDRFIERGVDAAFAQQAIATPHSTLWFPDVRELEQAGVVTQHGGTKAFATPSTGKDLSALLDWSIFNTRLESAYAAAYPENYAALRAEAWATIRAEGFGSQTAFTMVAKALDGALAPTLASASDAAAADFVRGVVSAIAYLTQVRPQDCYQAIDGDLMTKVSGAGETEDRLEAHYLRITIALFEAVARGPRQQPPTRAEYEAALASAKERWRRSGFIEAGDKAVIASPQTNSARYCALAVRFFNTLLQEPQPGQSLLLRGVLLYHD